MDFWAFFLVALPAAFGLMTGLWLLSLKTKDASIVDRFWGAGFVFIAWVLFLARPDHGLRHGLILAMVTIWGGRLSLHIHFRNRGHGEDYRYKEMRDHHGQNFWWYSLFSVFLLQGGLMLLVSAPIIGIMAAPASESLGPWEILGFVVWAIGFYFEAMGDWQLTQFKKNPANRGKLLTTGLWSLTRHPNYFGDALQWWGNYVVALAVPMGWATFIGPLTMTWFIRKISGVDLLEKAMKSTKPGYEDYIAETPAFIPRLPRLKKKGIA